MARAAAAAVALLLIAAASGDAARPRLPAPMVPPLRSAADLERGQIDSGVGVFPALVDPAGLGFPRAAALRNARRWLAARDARGSFAVATDRTGIAGAGLRERFDSASVTKAMLLASFLRLRGVQGIAPTTAEIQALGYMIRLSDNASADQVYGLVDDEGLREVARAAGMRDFEVSGDWANATVTAADQARFFLALDELLPPVLAPLGFDLLRTVSAPHSWGVPAGAPRGWTVYFKGGWRPETDGELVHQGALLKRGGDRIALAVLTEGNRDQRYGERTIEGVARRILAPGPRGRAAALLPVARLTSLPPHGMPAAIGK